MERIRSSLIALIMAAMLANPVLANYLPADPNQDLESVFTSTDCPFEIPMGAAEGENLECGYVDVPENRLVDNGKTISLAVAILKSTSTNPEPDPLFMLQGGPGGSTLETFVPQIFMMSTLREDRDIVLFDQRGTLYSEPNLFCEEIYNLTLSTLTTNLPLSESLKKYEQAVAQCRIRLEREGIDLNAFNSYENAADVQAVRQALGYSEINLYGVSYGTLLALHTLRLYPEGLRTVILDAVVPTQTNFLLEAPKSENRAFTKLFEACRQDPDCSGAYPDLEGTFFELVDRFNQTPANIEIMDMETGQVYPAILNGDGLMSAVFQMMYATDIIPFIPRAIQDASSGEFGFLQRILGLLWLDRSMSYGMYYSVICAEDADFSTQQFDYSGLLPKITENETQNLESFLRTCEDWNVNPLGSQVDEPVQSNIPTLILNGEFDPITPPAFGLEASKSLPNSFVVNFPANGHGAAMSGGCADDVINQFLKNPDVHPNTDCVKEKTSPVFMTEGNTLLLPVIGELLNLAPQPTIELVVFFIGLFFLITAPLIWIFIWIIRKLSKSTNPTRTLMAHLSRWSLVITGLLLTVFIIVLLVSSFQLALKNNLTILYGLPKTYSLLFLLPLVSFILAIFGLISAILAYVKKYWSIWNRIYFSFLVFSSWVCMMILFRWEMVFAIFQ